jgi:hypothetical protein
VPSGMRTRTDVRVRACVADLRDRRHRMTKRPLGSIAAAAADRPTHRAFNRMRQELCRTLAVADGGLAEGHGAGRRQRLDLDRRAFRFVGGACALQEPLREGPTHYAGRLRLQHRSGRPNWPLSAPPGHQSGAECCAPTRSARPAWTAPNTRVRGARLRVAVLAALAAYRGVRPRGRPRPRTTPSPTAWPRS